MKSRRGFTLIEVIVIMAIIAVLLALLLPAVQRVRYAAYKTKCMNNLKQIGLANYQYHNDNQSLPSGCSYQGRKDPFPFMSWCTRLLPYLEQGSLWQQAEEAYAQERRFGKSPPHVGNQVLSLFLCPLEQREVVHRQLPLFSTFSTGLTSYLGVEGTNQDAGDGLFYLNSKVRFEQISDGVSCTIMVGERPPDPDGHFGWWYAGWGQQDDGSACMVLGVREIGAGLLSGCRSVPRVNRFQPGLANNECDALHFWSWHDGGSHFLFADGSVRFLAYSADGVLPSLATRAGGEAAEIPD